MIIRSRTNLPFEVYISYKYWAENTYFLSRGQIVSVWLAINEFPPNFSVPMIVSDGLMGLSIDKDIIDPCGEFD